MTIRHRQPSLKTDPVSNEKKAERRKTITECETFKATCTKAPCVSTLREDFVAAGRKSTWLFPLVSVPIFGCILYLLLHYLLFLDLNKRIYNHVPGECSYLPGGKQGGIADIQVVNNYTLIASSGFDVNNASNSTGGILLWRLNEHESKFLELKTAKGQPKTKFNPYGISYVMGILFVVNMRRPLQNTDTVEILHIEDGGLQRVRSPIKSPMFTSLCDVQGLDAKRFYATNSFSYRHTALQIAEFVTHRQTASLLYFDGKRVHKVLDGLGAGISGLGIRQRRLYVSILGRDEIRVYTMGADPKILDLKEVIPVYSAPHFFHLEPRSEAFVVAAHPNKLKFLLQRQWPYDYFAPSQVLRFQKLPKSGKWRVTQMYANDGATISGASVAALLSNNQIAIGDLKHGLLRCALTSV